MTAGQKLRLVREQLGLTIREVETASSKIGSLKHNDEFTINISRLSDFETKGVVPSIFRLFSLASIYKVDLLEMLSWYGVDFKDKAEAMGLVKSPDTHRANPLDNVTEVRIPVRLDHSFDLKRTSRSVSPRCFRKFAHANSSFNFVFLNPVSLTRHRFSRVMS